MPHEVGIQQRAIVGRRLTFSDSELVTKYTLPFVDPAWKVPFIILDVLGSPPRIFSGPLHLDGTRLRTPEPRATLRPIESIPTGDFAALVHYDPWWAFRGVSGVDRTWIQAILGTNIARPFHHEGKSFKIHDLRFADGMDHLEAVIAKDEFFRAHEFHAGEIDLFELRGTPHVGPNNHPISWPTKAL